MPRIQQVIAVLVVLISLALGWYAWIVGQRAVAPQSAPPAGSMVVVAAKALPAGVPIAADGVRSQAVSLRPEGAFEQAAAVVGKVPAEALVAGEPILAKRLQGGEGPALAVPVGERAVAVRVDEVSGVANRLQPRDRVDVFVVLRRSSDEVGETQARLLLPDIPILAVGARAGAGRDNEPGARAGAEVPHTVVLAVPQAEVSRLLVASETGRLLLALKSAGESGAAKPGEGERSRWLATLSDNQRTTLRHLAGGAAPAAAGPALPPPAPGLPAAPRPAVPAVEVIRGSTQGETP